MSAERIKTQVFENERDRSLVAAIRLGDRTGLEDLYRHYHERVYRSCLHTCRDPEDAIDATQEAFLNVFRRVGDIDLNIGSFRDYLFMTSRNISLKIIAKRGRSTPTSEPLEPDGLVRATDDPERSALIGVQREIVRRATGSLNQRQVDALTMYEIEGKSYSEIGEYLGIEANAVAQLLMRARIRLKKAVRRRAAQTPSNDGCSDALSLLSKKTDGVLHDGERDWLDSHLNGCDTCRTNLLVMEEVGANYRSLMPVPAALIFERVFSEEALAEILEQSRHSDASTETCAEGQEAGTPGNCRASSDRASRLGLQRTLHSRKRGDCNSKGSKTGRGKKTAAATVAILLLLVAVIAPAGLKGMAERDSTLASNTTSDELGQTLAAGFTGSRKDVDRATEFESVLSEGGKAGFTSSAKTDKSKSAGEKKVAQSSWAKRNSGQSTASVGNAKSGATVVHPDKKPAKNGQSKKSPEPGTKSKKKKSVKKCKGIGCKSKGHVKKKITPLHSIPGKHTEKAHQPPSGPPKNPPIPHPYKGKSGTDGETTDPEPAGEGKPKDVKLTIPKIKNKLPEYDCTSKIGCFLK